MGFSLQAVAQHGPEAEEYMSLSNEAMRDVCDVIEATPSPPSAEQLTVLSALSVNEGRLVSAEQCRWLAERLARADRARIAEEGPEADELLTLIDELMVFC